MNQPDPKTFKPLVVLIGKRLLGKDDYADGLAEGRTGFRVPCPEHMIHHTEMKDRVERLRASTETYSRVICVTYSPYLLDHVDPETDTLLIFVKHDGEVKIRELDKSPDGVWQQQKGVFTLGEIWTAEGEARLAGLVVSKD